MTTPRAEQLEQQVAQLRGIAETTDARLTQILETNQAMLTTLQAMRMEAQVNPESTEGGRRVSVLKRQEGAPVLLG